MQNLEFRKERKETLIGKLMEGTPYEDYAINNQILGKNDDFIEHKTGTSRFAFAIIYKGNTYGIWYDYKGGKVYVSQDYQKESMHIFSITKEDNKPNVIMLKRIKTFLLLEKF